MREKVKHGSPAPVNVTRLLFALAVIAFATFTLDATAPPVTMETSREHRRVGCVTGVSIVLHVPASFMP
jgi:hypothetical protein